MFRVKNTIADFTIGLDKGINEEVKFLKKFFINEGDICLFPIVKWENYDIAPIYKDYINKRLYVANHDMLWDVPDDVMEEEMLEIIYWVKPENDKELKELLEEDPYTYGLCIIKRDEYELKNYKFLLSIEENFYFKRAEYRALIVEAGNDKESLEEVWLNLGLKLVID